MTGRRTLLLAAVLAGCSGLDAGDQGVVGIEVRVPGPDTVEVAESIQLSAKPLNSDGDSVGTEVTWRSADAAAVVGASSGILTGVSPGSARVQALVGALGSALITFAVVSPADTLALASDSAVLAPSDGSSFPSLSTSLASFHPAGPLASRGVIYAITSPDPAAGPPAVVLTGNVSADTVFTGADGIAATALMLVTGATPPDSAIVTVRASRTRGAPVPGSGQRFIVRFAP